MNKIVNIHLAGSVYHVDEIAYQLLKNYLSSVEDFLQPNSDVKKIIYDIEQRIQSCSERNCKIGKRLQKRMWKKLSTRWEGPKLMEMKMKN